MERKNRLMLCFLSQSMREKMLPCVLTTRRVLRTVSVPFIVLLGYGGGVVLVGKALCRPRPRPARARFITLHWIELLLCSMNIFLGLNHTALQCFF